MEGVEWHGVQGSRLRVPAYCVGFVEEDGIIEVVGRHTGIGNQGGVLGRKELVRLVEAQGDVIHGGLAGGAGDMCM